MDKDENGGEMVYTDKSALELLSKAEEAAEQGTLDNGLLSELAKRMPVQAKQLSNYSSISQVVGKIMEWKNSPGQLGESPAEAISELNGLLLQHKCAAEKLFAEAREKSDAAAGIITTRNLLRARLGLEKDIPELAEKALQLELATIRQGGDCSRNFENAQKLSEILGIEFDERSARTAMKIGRNRAAVEAAIESNFECAEKQADDGILLDVGVQKHFTSISRICEREGISFDGLRADCIVNRNQVQKAVCRLAKLASIVSDGAAEWPMKSEIGKECEFITCTLKTMASLAVGCQGRKALEDYNYLTIMRAREGLDVANGLLGALRNAHAMKIMAFGCKRDGFPIFPKASMSEPGGAQKKLIN